MAQPNHPDPTGRSGARRFAGGVFGSVSADLAWTPQINFYQSANTLRVCVDLAGVPREQIGVSVEPGRLVITGVRLVPEPEDTEAHRIRVMEIDHGRFERVVSLPEQVDLDQVTSHYLDGLLWISLPLISE
ncbi:MAG: Hsp20/alpha crystallin family protein [Planctomycetota bacterium]